jgi:hypothetical protein
MLCKDYDHDLENPEVLFSDKSHFDNVREAVCFRVINRGGLWYDLLTTQEKDELLQWYMTWLNAWETKVVPQTPIWLK